MLYLQIESPKSSVLNFLDSNSFEVIISIFQRTEKVPDMERLPLYKLPGFCNLDFKVNNGEYYFIELNVRFAGSGIFSIIASFNYMETYLEHFVLNKPLQDMDYYMKYVCWDSIVTRYLEELIYPNISE